MTARVINSVLLFLVSTGFALDKDECLMCHGDPELSTIRGQEEISLYVDDETYSNSVHKDLECVSCHPDADVDELPHPERLDPVECGICHDQARTNYDAGIHGQAFHNEQAYAPTCSECHGKHDILKPENTQSAVFRMNVPYLCGRCHKEGAPVARVYNITEHNILDNYSQSIHGEGLFKKGLLVTATCIDCHNSHKILPHENINSSVHVSNIAETCMRCHTRIEEVHVKVIEGEKWQSSPEAIPACNDCHLPHKVRKPTTLKSLSDRSCLSCHKDQTLHKTIEGQEVALYVDMEKIEASVHTDVTCVKCHSDVDPRLHRPCATTEKVNCTACHTTAAEDYTKGGHGKAFEKGIEDAPGCTTCHGSHEILPRRNEDSNIYRAAIPQLCGDCHSEDKQIKAVSDLSEVDALFDYSKSVHGKQLMEQGLLPSAVCSDCHNAHMVLDHKHPQSSIHKKNIPATCAQCHKGIYEDFTKSIHFSTDREEQSKLPTCTHCHSSHRIQEVQKDQFMSEVTRQCGSCHGELAETYMQTMHGKAYQLGYMQSAKCSDCHNSHLILPASNPNSSIGFRNIVTTCQQCHEDANERFTGYLTHATHHDQDKYPILFYVYWFMTILLVSVFAFFGIHTLLWLPRSFRHMFQRRKEEHKTNLQYYYKRFELSHRVMHLFVIVSFMALAITGMMLKFSSMEWAGYIADAIGGVRVAGVIHRIAAVITFGYFITHIVMMIRRKFKSGMPWRRFLFGPDSMMFGKKDLKDFGATIKWFVGLGERPNYGRWTYWEKFDYFAVFWGVAVIGISGLMLWFPEFFTLFVPGWLINVATIIHSDEALLAVGFIFTIHFFNTHLRPEVFPMDKVIFTGLVPLEEYKKDRPKEFEELRKSGHLKKKIVKKPVSRKRNILVTIMGLTFLAIGITLIVLIIYSMLFGYQ